MEIIHFVHLSVASCDWLIDLIFNILRSVSDVLIALVVLIIIIVVHFFFARSVRAGAMEMGATVVRHA